MKVTDVSTLINSAAENFNGLNATVNQDLTNVVDFGRAIEDKVGYDVFFGAMVDRINDLKFWARPYVSFAPSVRKEAAEYGAIRGMYRTGYMKSIASPVYNLQEGVSYDPNVVHKQTVDVRFWADKFSAMLEPQTIVTEQIRSAFTSSDQLMSFIGMLELARINSHGRAMDEMIMSLFQAGIANAINSGGMQDIKLLTEYNTIFSGATVTSTNALYSEGFIRYAIYRMGIIRDQMSMVTGMFNSSSYEAQTTPERQRVVMISDFADAAGVYLHDAPNQFNTGSLTIPGAEKVPAWQGMGTTGALSDRMNINTTVSIAGNSVSVDTSQGTTSGGVLGVVYDDWAMGITAEEHKVSTQWNPLGRFTNYFDHMFGGMFFSPDENFVVFRLA